MLLDSQEIITPAGAVLGLINGMVGSLVLYLPVLALSSGYAASAILIIVSGISCIMSSWIYLQHLGEEPDIGLAMKKHFKGKNLAKNIYQFLTWFFLVVVCAQYFQLIDIQWTILIPELKNNTFYHTITNVIIAIFIYGLVLALKYWEIGAITMIYGVISIGIYLIYLLGICISENTKTSDVMPFVPFGSGAKEIGGAMTQGFVIQIFLIPFLQKIGNHREARNRFFKYTLLSYVFGAIIYQYIALIGSFGTLPSNLGIMYRSSSYDMSVETFGIMSYLDKSWVLDTVCVTYLIHLFTVYPEFLLISKKKFFQSLEKWGFVETSRRSINLRQLIYIGSIVAISMIFSLIRLPMDKVIIINGGVLSCLIVYIIPACLHIYCMFWVPQYFREPFSTIPELKRDNNKIKISQNSYSRRKSQIQISDVQSFSSRKSKNQENSADNGKVKQVLLDNKREIKQSFRTMEFGYVQCECDHYKRSKIFKFFMVLFLIFMIVFGVTIMTFSVLAMIE